MRDSHHSTLTRGYTIAVISAVVLSTTGILIRHVTQTYHLPPLILAFWRDAFVAVTLFLTLGLTRIVRLYVPRDQLAYLCVYGLMLAIFNSLWTTAVALSGAAIATVLVYSSGGFTTMIAWWLFRERVDRTKLLVIALTLAGCILVAEAMDPAAWQVNGLGILTGVLSGLWYAIYTLMGRSAAQRGLNAWTTVFYTFGFAALFLLAANLVSAGWIPGTAATPSDLFWLGDAVAGWGALLLLAAGPTLVGFGLYNVSLSYLPSSVANLVVTLEPVFTAITAYILLNERLNGVQIVGSLLILTGVFVLRLHEGRATVLPNAG